MAHRTTGHHRSSAVPDSKTYMPPRTISSSSHLQTDLSQPFSIKRVNTTHKLRTPHRPTSPPPSAASSDVRLQAKSLSASAIFDSSLSKPNRQPRTAPKSEKETHKPAKPLKKAKEFPDNNNKSKLREATLKDKELKVEESVLGGLDMRKLSVSLDGGRRRSLGGARVDVADFLANNGARIVSVDMPPFMQIHAVDFARKARDSLEKFTARTLASTLKKEFDGVYGPAWHCIVGTSFGSFVTHSVGGFLYFSLDQKMYILLFKTTVQRAD